MQVYISYSNCEVVHNINYGYKLVTAPKHWQPYHSIQQNALSEMGKKSANKSDDEDFGVGYLLASHCLHDVFFSI